MMGMEDVLAAHWSASTHTDRKPFVDKCDGCGEVIFSWGDPTVTNGADRLAKHQAAALQAAGFGNQHDAWEEGAESGRRSKTVNPFYYEPRPSFENPYPAPKVSET